jgi:glycosyltransferase involved in cell wall biosynthesis
MKISIITPSYNQGNFIEDCILSVLNQGHLNFEHIIIDAQSSDNTISILKKYPHLIWISEKDNGQSHALNKGLNLASGEIIGWLNSDDMYCPGVFSKIENIFEESGEIDWIVGNQYKVFQESNMVLKMPFKEISFASISRNCDILRTQSAFYRKCILNKVGGFDEKFHFVMDYDLWIKLSRHSNPLNIKDYVSIFRVHNSQKTSFVNSFKQIRELKVIFLRENLFVGFLNKILSFLWYNSSSQIKCFLIFIGLLNVKYKELPIRKLV